MKVGAANFSVFGIDQKTNNCCESFHSRISRTLTKHPALFVFLENLINKVMKPAMGTILQQANAKLKWNLRLTKQQLKIEEEARELESKYTSGELYCYFYYYY